MGTKYKIIPDFSNRGLCKVHPNSLVSLGIENKRKLFVRFGINSYEVKVITSNQVDSDEIVLSSDTIDSLKIPLAPMYETKSNISEIILGPYIGILTSKSNDSLDKTINNLSNFVYDYERIGGAILVFSLEGVDKQNKIVRGYIFNPQTKKWQLGSYPCPSVIFKRIGLNKKWRDFFQSTIGSRIFNDYVFNKWEMYMWLSNYPQIKPHLADTIIYKQVGDITAFLDLHEKIYIKPIYGSQGIGIIEAIKKGSGLLIKYRENERNKELAFVNMHEAKFFFKQTLKKNQYILQEALDLYNSNGGLIDFRLLILKDENGDWNDIGIIARHGNSGSIVSNVSSGGLAEPGEIALKNSFNFSDDQVSKTRKFMSKLSIEAAKAIEKSGVNCGNLGVDLGIDCNNHIWIIEINSRDPNHTIAIDAGDRQMFYNSKLTTMLYAKRLAGFIEE